MELKFPVTLNTVLVGLVPFVTLTVSSVKFPACKEFGAAEPVEVGGVELGVTVKDIDALPIRDCASAIDIVRVLPPALVFAGTVAEKEKTLSPEVTSPCVPSSN